MTMARTHFRSVDEYISTFPKDVQDVLEKIRRTIKEAAPASQETISYQMPAFTHDGNLLYFGAFKNHIGLYGASGAVEAFKDDLSPYANAKGAIRFPLDKPIPFALIR